VQCALVSLTSALYKLITYLLSLLSTTCQPLDADITAKLHIFYTPLVFFSRIRHHRISTTIRVSFRIAESCRPILPIFTFRWTIAIHQRYRQWDRRTDGRRHARSIIARCTRHVALVDKRDRFWTTFRNNRSLLSTRTKNMWHFTTFGSVCYYMYAGRRYTINRTYKRLRKVIYDNEYHSRSLAIEPVFDRPYYHLQYSNHFVRAK